MDQKSKTVICKDLQGNTFDVRADELSFRPSVYGLIIEDNKILLSKQWDGYDLPGGGIHLGESIEEALIREVREETGVEVEPGVLVANRTSFFKTPHRGRYIHSILMYYTCNRIGGELSTKYFDEEEKTYAGMPEWIDIARLEDIKTIKFYSSMDLVEIIRKAVEMGK